MNGRAAAFAAGTVLVPVLVLAAAACSGGGAHPPAPAPVVATTSTTATTMPDDAIVVLGGVQGSTTVPPVGVTPGPVTVSGSVVDDTGAPVGAATVALERVVGSGVGSTDVTTAEDGSWRVQGILGGLYRIRAWRAPDLAQPTGTVVFLSAGGPNPSVALHVQHFTGTTVQTVVAPDPPIIGAPAELVVQVTSASVDGSGVVHQQPQPGALVSIIATGQWSVDGNPTQPTSAAGDVSWQATCEALGVQGLTVTIDAGAPVDLSVAACSPVPTTTIPASTTTTGAGTPTTAKTG